VWINSSRGWSSWGIGSRPLPPLLLLFLLMPMLLILLILPLPLTVLLLLLLVPSVEWALSTDAEARGSVCLHPWGNMDEVT
jgi:hypothetical protein